jgi:hypothetical protein
MFTQGAYMKLHERQQRILEVIEEAVKAQGYPPTVREIGAAVGLCSPASVQGHLGALEAIPNGGLWRSFGPASDDRPSVSLILPCPWSAEGLPGFPFLPTRISRTPLRSLASWVKEEPASPSGSPVLL